MTETELNNLTCENMLELFQSFFMDAHQFLELLKNQGYSWSGYRKVWKGIKKRGTNVFAGIVS
jgi:hypothetical protein